MRCNKSCRIRRSTVDLLVTVREMSLCYITQEHTTRVLCTAKQYTRCTQMNMTLYLIAYFATTNRFTNAIWSPAPALSLIFT